MVLIVSWPARPGVARRRRPDGSPWPCSGHQQRRARHAGQRCVARPARAAAPARRPAAGRRAAMARRRRRPARASAPAATPTAALRQLRSRGARRAHRVAAVGDRGHPRGAAPAARHPTLRQQPARGIGEPTNSRSLRRRNLECRLAQRAAHGAKRPVHRMTRARSRRPACAAAAACDAKAALDVRWVERLPMGARMGQHPGAGQRRGHQRRRAFDVHQRQLALQRVRQRAPTTRSAAAPSTVSSSTARIGGGRGSLAHSRLACRCSCSLVVRPLRRAVRRGVVAGRAGARAARPCDQAWRIRAAARRCAR